MRILLVEDDAGTREALTALLRVGGHDPRACANGAAGLAALEENAAAFDAAVVDMMLPDMAGPDLIRGLRARLPDLPVLVLTVFEDPALILEAIRAGASGYLLKGSTLAEVCRAVEQTHAGLSPLSAEVARHLLDHVRPAERPASGPAPQNSSPSLKLDSLSEQERRILERLARGHAYAAIARELNLQLGTVQTYVKKIYRKLEVSSKAEAAWVSRLESR